jgi:DNA primase
MSSRPIDVLLSRLEYKPAGKNKYKAKCPAHDDRSPSMMITEADDGKVLVHCFAGCSIHDIVTSVGLEIGDLFPDSIKSRPYPTKQDIEEEKAYLQIQHKRMQMGQQLDPIELNRVEKAIHRLRAISHG